jgi:hypothetical protein
MINIDKEIKLLKKSELNILEKENGNFLNIDKFNEYLEEEDSSFLYNFVVDIKKGVKRNVIPVFYKMSPSVNNLIQYITKYFLDDKISIVNSNFEYFEHVLKLNKKDNKIIILDNNSSKNIDFNKLAEICLDDKINWHFIFKSYTKNLPETLCIILNLQKKWINEYKIFDFIHNFDIYDIKIYIEENENKEENKDKKILVFRINCFHHFKIKFTNILKIFEFFKEGINMNSAILHINNSFSMNFDDILFSINIHNDELTSKLQFYNNPLLRIELNNFITKYKKDICVLN